MKTVRRLLYAEILGSVAFVMVAFLALFYFIDFVTELGQVGRGAYRIQHAALYCLLELPGYLYELLPIAVLIGTIYAMARLAQSSEFTILRTAGLGPGRALAFLAALGLLFGVIAFVIGDYVAPHAEARGNALRSLTQGDPKRAVPSLRTGVWLKDRHPTGPTEQPSGERVASVHVGQVGAGGRLADVRIFEFDAEGQLLTRISAARAQVGDAQWALENVLVSRWPGATGSPLAADERLDTMIWTTSLSPSVVSAAVATLRTMSTVDLYHYMSHLSENEQAAQRQQIQFWKKALYPLACLVMVGLALPFAYLHARAGGVSFKVFAGILLGISFVLLNNLSTHLGLLRDWTPWVAAAAPSALYLLLSLAAFSWLVRYR